MTEENNNEGIRILNAGMALSAMRAAPYTTMSALAELIDNSLDAEANSIHLIAVDKEERTPTGTRVQRLDQLAVYDNGVGMDEETIQACLAVGFSFGRGGNKDIGKFGFGMTIGSLSQSYSVKVYSWQNGGPIKHTYIDLGELSTNESSTIPAIQEVDLKDVPIIGQLQQMKRHAIEDSGTLIIWDKLDDDRVKVKTSRGITDRFKYDLSRIYRHFLDDDDGYGTKREIDIIRMDSAGAVSKPETLLANDPLYLLKPNTLPILQNVDYSKQATNEVFEKIMVPIEYTDDDGINKESDVELTFTMAKPEIRALGGHSIIGKHYARNAGISFVRSGREIEINDFGFVNRYETTERWWGCEVRFKPCLDKLFGVSNDKQKINGIKGYDDNNLAPILGEDFDDKSVAMNLILDRHIKDIVGKLRTYLRANKITRGPSTGTKTTEERVNAEIKKEGTLRNTFSKQESQDKTREDKLKEHIVILVDKDPKLSLEEATQQAELKIDWEADFITRKWPGTMFLESTVVGSGIQAQVNVGTQFYETFFSHLEDNIEKDPKSLEAMKIVLLAYSLAEDQLTPSTDPERVIFPEFRERWGYWVQQLIHISSD